MEHFFATCPRGLEAGARRRACRARRARSEGRRRRSRVRGRVRALLRRQPGEPGREPCPLAGRACRVPERARHPRSGRSLPWPRHFDVRRSIRVDTAAIRSPVKSLDFVTLSVKDAVCDAFRAARGSRPDVDTQAPDVRIHVFLTCRFGDLLSRHLGRAALPARLARRPRRSAAAREPRRGHP